MYGHVSCTFDIVSNINMNVLKFLYVIQLIWDNLTTMKLSSGLWCCVVLW